MDAIRPATPDDWHVVRDLRLLSLETDPESFGSTHAREVTYDEDKWRSRTENTFLAWVDGEAVGLAAGVWGQEAEVVSLWVAPAHRGAGLGAQLIEAVGQRAAELGATTVTLWVADGNPGARRVYERLRFRTTGQRGLLVSNPEIGQERLARPTSV